MVSPDHVVGCIDHSIAVPICRRIIRAECSAPYSVVARIHVAIAVVIARFGGRKQRDKGILIGKSKIGHVSESTTTRPSECLEGLRTSIERDCGRELS